MRRSPETAAVSDAALTTPLLLGDVEETGATPSAAARETSAVVAFDLELGAAASSIKKPDSLEIFLSKVGITKTGLSTAEINYDTLQELWALDQPLHSQLRWANVNHLLEKPFQLLMLLFSTCPPIFYWGRSMLLDNTLQLRFVYAVTAFVRGGLSFVDHALHGFILFVLFYGLLGNEINLNLDSLKSIYQSREEVGVVNLVHLLNHLSANMLNLVLYSPFIWGAFKILTTNYAVTRPTQQYAQPLLKRFQKHKSGMLRNTIPWLFPQSRFASDLRKIDLMLTWDARIYQREWFVGAEQFLNETIKFAKGKFAYTSIEAMSTLRLVAHGMALTDLLHLKKAGIPTETLTNIIKIKAKAFQAIIEIANTPKNIREKLRDFPRYVYARYLLWDLGAFKRIQGWNVPITIFKAFKLYALVKLYQTIYNTIQAAKECPDEPGFQLGVGFPPSSTLYTIPCFEMLVNFFRALDPNESVEAFIAKFSKFNLQGLTNLDLSNKTLLWNETRAILDGLLGQGVQLTSLDLSINAITFLPAYAFQGLNTLLSLALHNNFISTMATSTFVGLDNLRALDLSQNNISNLIADSFLGLRHLLNLNLGYNFITTIVESTFIELNGLFSLDLSFQCAAVECVGIIASRAFAGLSYLQSLNLKESAFATLAFGAFEGLSQLQILDLSSNAFSTITAGVFSGLNRLLSLNLGFNYLTDLPGNIFLEQISLQRLDLSFNKLVSIAAGVFSRLSHLQYLDVSYNGLYNLTGDFLENFPLLRALNITGNAFTTLPAGIANATLLEELGLGGNALIPESLDYSFFLQLPSCLQSLSLNGYTSDYPILALNGTAIFSRFEQLQNLDLRWNGISTLVSGIFSGLNTLKYLDLGDNSISSIASGAFTGLMHLQHLDLSYQCNPMQCLSNITFGTFAGLGDLLSLDLSHNNINTVISGIFVELSNLQNLDLSENSLSSIAVDVFIKLSNLQRLDLSDNSISDIPAGIFSKLGSLQSLDLSLNLIGSIASNFFVGLSNLLKLDLSYQCYNAPCFYNISSDAFTGLSDLLNLNLGFNQLNDLASNTFIKLRNLQILDLSNNQLTDSAIAALTNAQFNNLQILNLATNQFTLSGVTQPLQQLIVHMNVSNFETGVLPLNLQDNNISASDLLAFEGELIQILYQEPCQDFRCYGIEYPGQSAGYSAVSAHTLALPIANNTTRSLITSPYAVFQNNSSTDFSKYVFWFVVATTMIATGIFLYQYFFKNQQHKEKQNPREKTNEKVSRPRKLFSGFSSMTLFSAAPKALPIAEKVAAQNEADHSDSLSV